jgi:signal-transduction protein with cAMP-binding, CBS, and nucleotidyltransferase domain
MGRIKALRAKQVLTADEFDYLTDAYELITKLLLTQQLRDFNAHRIPGKHVAPEALGKRRKHLLVESLKSIRSLRLRVRLELQAAAT